MNRLEAIRQREQAATEGPWRWGGNIDQRDVYLSTVDRGRIFIMRFVRWGTHGARPTFQNPDPDGWGTTDADALAVREQPYRGDIATIDHPDARFIAHARTDVPLLLAAVEAFRALPEHVLYCRDSVQGICTEHDSPFSSTDPDGDCDVVQAIRDALAPLLEPVGE